MTSKEALKASFGPFVDALAAALAAGDELAFHKACADLRDRADGELTEELRKITNHAQSALRRFRDDARIDSLADEEVPDARKRLAHVVEITDEAAHRTLDLVEQSLPVIDSTGRAAAELLEEWSAGEPTTARVRAWSEKAQSFLLRAAGDAERVRGNLSQMLLAQGYQDITGQIIRSVIGLVEDLEVVLGDLVRITEGQEITRRVRAVKVMDLRRGAGPQIAGVSEAAALNGQGDIDALLKSVGLD